MPKTVSLIRLFSLVTAFLTLSAGGLADDGNVFPQAADQLQTHLNYLWVLLSAVLVFLMQAGFMCFESGLATAKNSINVAIKNLADFVISSVLFWLVGFGFMFGVSETGWIGGSDFLITQEDPWRVIFFVFQVVFVGTAATINSGALAGRTKFVFYLIVSACISMLIYPVFGHWAWGSTLHGPAAAGWLEKMGFIDFAGSTVVHSVGGWVAMAGCLVVGPRIGKYDADGRVNYIPPHNMTLTYLGTFILFFGWFGFNCGSTLEVNDRIPGIAMNTLMAASFGCISASALSWIYSPFHRPQGEMIANGILGGLVGITAGCAFVETTGAVLIGLVAGLLVFYGNYLIEKVLRIDDVVGAIAVHGICGAWGTIAVGIFMTPDHLGNADRLHQIGIQAVGVVSCFAWSFGSACILLKFIDRFMGGMRVSREDEILGLNIAEHGARSTLHDLVESMHDATRKNDFSGMAKVAGETGTDIGALCDGFNRMVEAIQKSLKETQRQIQNAEAARATSEQAERMLSRNREAYEEKIREIAGNLGQLMAEVEHTMSSVAAAAQKVQHHVDSLAGKSDEIDGVLASVEKIAFSTKLLATNAMIQAAHAGEAGTGFSVVSQQMGDVAKHTETASGTIARFTEEIKQLLNAVIDSIHGQLNEIHEGTLRIDRAGQLIRELMPESPEDVQIIDRDEDLKSLDQP